MDDYGIQSQILYPNVAVFDAKTILGLTTSRAAARLHPGLQRLPRRLRRRAPGTGSSPVTALPFWDLDATLAEIERCAAMGHKGIVFTQDPSVLRPAGADRPPLGSDVGVGAGEGPAGQLPHRLRRPGPAPASGIPTTAPRQLRGDGRLVLPRQREDHRAAHLRRDLPPLPDAQLRLGRERRRLDPVRPRRRSTGSGRTAASPRSTRSTTCCRASTSSARSTAASGSSTTRRCRRIEQLGADNILYETDFPHPTSMSPGPASTAQRPDEYLRDHFVGLDEATLRKILHDNAARIYHLD